jgi:hypothetical protein
MPGSASTLIAYSTLCGMAPDLADECQITPRTKVVNRIFCHVLKKDMIWEKKTLA